MGRCGVCVGGVCGWGVASLCKAGRGRALPIAVYICTYIYVIYTLPIAVAKKRADTPLVSIE